MVKAAESSPKQRKRLAHGGDHIPRQQLAQVAGDDARAVAGHDAAQLRACAPGKQVAHRLAGGFAGAAAEEEGAPLDAALQLHASQRMIAAEVLGADADQQRAVGVDTVAGIAAHAVGDDAARLAGGGDDAAAGAHAERVDAPAGGQMQRELVIRRAEGGVGRKSAVLRLIDQRLRMLDARADGERLLRQRKALLAEHREGVARAVADGEHGVVGRQLMLTGGILINERLERAVCAEDAGHPCVEMHFAAEAENPFAHGPHDPGELVRADVRLGVDEDVVWRAEAHKRAQNVLAAGILCAGVQLAVGERARAALAELHVGGGGKRRLPIPPVGGDVARARVDILPALQDDGARARLGERQRGEETTRPQADDDGAGRGRGAQHGQDRRRIGHGKAALGGTQARGDAALILRGAERNIERDDEADVAFFARVHALFGDGAVCDLRGRHAEALAGGCGQDFFRIRKRELDVVNAKHGHPFCRKGAHRPYCARIALAAVSALAKAKCRL